MSRTTIKLKNPRTPLKATKRRVSVSSTSSSSLDLSDDEGYSAVEDLSESEDDEHNVMAAEEEHLLTRASRKRPLEHTPRPQVNAQEEEHDADEEDEEEDEEDEQNEDGDDEEDDDEEPEDDDDNAADDNESWGGLSEHEESTIIEQVPEPSVETEVSVKRHVRFAGIPDDDSDSDSTTTETESNADLFPDIFVDRNELDPAFRIEIERGNESSSAESFWDYDGNPQEFFGDSEDEAQVPQNMLAGPLLPSLMVPIPTITPEPSDSALSKSHEAELDGYETDGETTEEEDPEPIIRKKQVARVESAPVSSESEAERPCRSQRGKPRVGRFHLDGSDSNKPIAVFNPNSRKIMIFKRDHQATDLATEAINDVPSANLDYFSPLLTNPGYLMMGAMVSSNTFGDFMNTQPWGPAEAFFPMGDDFYAGDDSDDSELGMEEVDEEEAKLDIEDFLRFDNSDSEADEELEYDPESAATSPTKKDSDKQDMHPLLNHLTNNADAVGAFRRNQINQQLILSDRATQESLSFSGPYYHGTLRGIKTGSLETVTTPITPARRRKNNSMVGPDHLFLPPSFPLVSPYFKVTPSPWRFHKDPPLNQIIAQKRKAPTTGPGGSLIDDPTTMHVHKRHRSNLSTVSELSVDAMPIM
ncbi:hypothetical protein GE21DRAFT_6759 [Neurospora crassa]|uniref:Uncharacterized protein n=2 Tax=Neurospora crassa TaxID=5141 RepID=V5IPM3_NEUCR|nr:hypothetical protein NCU05182 [Neurospora crassa OR74A]ESA43104.1 hypothetical protein NCU05182 [Neurospora crassa OR74A]KHE79549.1 hypothetical protein GE21DRAFT_6759 [Neurospora crassa]CAF06109.1 hypothetical protein [Neurospora crassa]|eukprot:XP_011394127.1 hypothetical protein NCU05182 [Neurospora crassa OR74A]